MTQQIMPNYENLIGIIKDQTNILDNFENRINENDVNDTLSMTKDIIDKYGPRLTGTESTKKAALKAKTQLIKEQGL